MESITIKFTANGQTLTGGGLYCASNTVHYIIADFELGDGWDGFDSVRAVWSNDFKCISTVLDPDGSCTVPHEVLERRGKVSVNLVGSILEDDELTDRLTTYPVLAITVDANAKICGTETAEVTPSQFEQYVAIVIAEVEKVTGMTAVAQALPEGSEPTANYSDGVLTLGIPKGDTGATGNGISRVEFNEDYSLTFYFTDSEPFTTPSIRGAQGARGYGIASVEKIGSVGLVDTYRINFEDPSVPATTFTVTNGEEGPQGPRGYTGETGNGIDRIELTDTQGAVKTYTIYFTAPNVEPYEYQVTDGQVTLAQLSAVLPTDTASGAIASFEDGSDLFDYLSCICEINPVQDLHGYDKPWVGGAGKNKLPNTATSGTVANVTYTVNSDGTIIANGTSNSWNALTIGTVTLPSGTYWLTSGIISADNYIEFVLNGSNVDTNSLSRRQFTLTQSTEITVKLYARPNKTATNLKLYPMICLDSETDTTYSPYENICPITGWTGCEVDVAGVNVWDEEWELGSINSSTGAKTTANNRIRSKNKIAVVPNCQYFFLNPNGTGNPVGGVFFYDANDNYIGVYYASPQYVNGLFTTPNNADYIYFTLPINYGTTYKNDISINYPSTDTTYHAHNPNSAVYPVSWQTEAGTVYGGTVDVVSGVLTVDKASVDLGAVDYAMYSSGFSRARFRTTALEQLIKKPPNNNTPVEAFSSIFDLVNWATGNSTNVVGVFGVDTDGDLSVWLNASDYSDATAFKTAMSGQTVVYELATPITYQLDPVQVACLLGQNNVWADCGDIEEVKYKADAQKWVEKQLREINTAILALS